MTTTKTLRKKVLKAFGKNIYLLGVDTDGIKYWLEAPSWDCGWYWGFGYVETYTNNRNPEKAKDIQSHQHWTSIVSGEIELEEITFGENKSELHNLFAQLYQLRREADAANRTDEGKWNDINQKQIPVITKQILALLTP